MCYFNFSYWMMAVSPFSFLIFNVSLILYLLSYSVCVESDSFSCYNNKLYCVFNFICHERIFPPAPFPFSSDFMKMCWSLDSSTHLLFHGWWQNTFNWIFSSWLQKGHLIQLCNSCIHFWPSLFSSKKYKTYFLLNLVSSVILLRNILDHATPLLKNLPISLRVKSQIPAMIYKTLHNLISFIPWSLSSNALTLFTLFQLHWLPNSF